VRLSGLSEEGNASQNICTGGDAAPRAPSGCASATVQMMSAVVLAAGSKPDAQPPTTRHTPSGLAPHLWARRRGLGEAGCEAASPFACPR
jgi:hypothetical protein